jgi:hypothetical protein
VTNPQTRDLLTKQSLKKRIIEAPTICTPEELMGADDGS